MAIVILIALVLNIEFFLTGGIGGGVEASGARTMRGAGVPKMVERGRRAAAALTPRPRHARATPQQQRSEGTALDDEGHAKRSGDKPIIIGCAIP